MFAQSNPRRPKGAPDHESHEGATVPNDEPPRGGDRADKGRRRRTGRPKDDPRPGDLKPQPQDRWGELYCAYKLYDRHGTLLYVGVTDDVVRQLTEHQRGTRLQWGGRLDDRSRWWGEVVHVTVEHLPAGTTAWEAALYGRNQLALGPRYNTEAGSGPEPARAARLEAEQRDAELHDRARQLHARHDGVTRLVRPTLSIVPRFPGSAATPAPDPEPEPAPVVGAHDARRPLGLDADIDPGVRRDPDADPDPDLGRRREPALAGSLTGRAGPAEPGRNGVQSAPANGTAPATAASGVPGPADRPGEAVATTTRPAPATLQAPAEPDADHSLDGQGRYLLLTMVGVFLGIVLLSLNQVLR